MKAALVRALKGQSAGLTSLVRHSSKGAEGPNQRKIEDWMNDDDCRSRADQDLSPKELLPIKGETLLGNEGGKETTIVSLPPPVIATLNLSERFCSWNVHARDRIGPSCLSPSAKWPARPRILKRLLVCRA